MKPDIFPSPENRLPQANIESKPGHLKEGVKPIMACVGTDWDFGSWESLKAHPFDIDWPGSGKNVDHLNYRMNIAESNHRGHKNAGDRTYLISQLSGRDKFSGDYAQCTGLIITGIDKETGEDISIMTHQDPYKFLGEAKEPFIKDISESMQELKARCEAGTIDAVILGGSFLKGDHVDIKNQYKESIKLLTEQVEANLGFEPLVIAGPKTKWSYDSAFYDSKNRRLYLIRDDQMQGEAANMSYRPGEIERESEKW